MEQTSVKKAKRERTSVEYAGQPLSRYDVTFVAVTDS